MSCFWQVWVLFLLGRDGIDTVYRDVSLGCLILMMIG